MFNADLRVGDFGRHAVVALSGELDLLRPGQPFPEARHSPRERRNADYAPRQASRTSDS